MLFLNEANISAANPVLFACLNTQHLSVIALALLMALEEAYVC